MIQVQGYDVLVRVAEGLGVSRGAMGLAYAGDSEGPEIYDEVTEEMRRRALLAVGAIALFNRPILGEVLHLPERPATPTPLPSQLGESDVLAIEELTTRLESRRNITAGVQTS